MGLFDLLFGKKETIWTLDMYIEKICASMRGRKRSPEETGKKIRKWGEEIVITYGLVGIDHAWRAVSLSDDSEALCPIVRKEWSGIEGWAP